MFDRFYLYHVLYHIRLKKVRMIHIYSPTTKGNCFAKLFPRIMGQSSSDFSPRKSQGANPLGPSVASYYNKKRLDWEFSQTWNPLVSNPVIGHAQPGSGHALASSVPHDDRALAEQSSSTKWPDRMGKHGKTQQEIKSKSIWFLHLHQTYKIDWQYLIKQDW